MSASTSTPGTAAATTADSGSSQFTFRFAHPFIYLFVLFGMSCLALAAFHPSLPRSLSLLQPVVDLAYFLFREQWVVQAVFSTAVGLHVGEALWVCVSGVLNRKGVVAWWDRVAWIGQTVLLGWGSVGLLRRLPDVRHSAGRSSGVTPRG